MPRGQRRATAETPTGVFRDTLTSNQLTVLRDAEDGIVRRRQSREDTRYHWFLDGVALISADEVLSAGEFGPWRDARTGLSERTAENYMSAARILTPDIGPENFSALHPRVRSTVFELAKATTPPEVRAVFLPRVICGERVPLREVRDAIEALRPPETKTTAEGAETGADNPDAAPEIEPPALITGTVEAVEYAEWFDTPPVAALIPMAPAVPHAVAPDATVSTPAPSEGQPIVPAQIAAVREIARMIRERMGFDGTCVANLIRHGLAVPLADEIEAECGDLPDASTRLESDDEPNADDMGDGPPIPDPDDDPFPHDEAEPFPVDADHGTPDPVVDVEETPPPSKTQTRVTFTKQGVPSLDNFGGFGPTPFGKPGKRGRMH